MSSPLEINPLSVNALLSRALSAVGLGLSIYDSVEYFIHAFAGKPTMLDTVQATQRLSQSSSPAIQQLARNFTILIKNGVPLSTGKQSIQAEIRNWIAGTIQTIGEQLGATLTTAQVNLLDKSIHNVIQSQVANSGTVVDQTIREVAQQIVAARPASKPAPPPKLKKPSTPPAIKAPGPPIYVPSPPPGGFVPQLLSAPVVLPPPKLPPALPPALGSKPVPVGTLPANVSRPITTLPQQQGQQGSSSLLDSLRSFAAQHPYLQLGGCISLAVAGLDNLAATCLEELLVQQVGSGIEQLTTQAKSYLRSLGQALRGQPAPMPAPLPAPQGGLLPAPQQGRLPVPIQPQPYGKGNGQLKQLVNQNGYPVLDQHSECTTCGQRFTLQKEIQTQRGQLQHEIDIEQEQDVEQQLTQTEQEISDLSKLENLPTSQRDIQSELQRKSALQSRLDTLETELHAPNVPVGPSPEPGQPAPVLKQDQQELLAQSRAALKHYETEVQNETIKPAVTFCVGCQTQEDAILFLNGEPSACSVVPGSTTTQ